MTQHLRARSIQTLSGPECGREEEEGSLTCPRRCLVPRGLKRKSHAGKEKLGFPANPGGCEEPYSSFQWAILLLLNPYHSCLLVTLKTFSSSGQEKGSILGNVFISLNHSFLLCKINLFNMISRIIFLPKHMTL